MTSSGHRGRHRPSRRCRASPWPAGQMRAEATHGVPLPSASRDVGEAVSDRAGARGARRRTLGIWGRPRPVRARHFIGRPVKMARDFLKFIGEGAAPLAGTANTATLSANEDI